MPCWHRRMPAIGIALGRRGACETAFSHCAGPRLASPGRPSGRGIDPGEQRRPDREGDALRQDHRMRVEVHAPPETALVEDIHERRGDPNTDRHREEAGDETREHRLDQQETREPRLCHAERPQEAELAGAFQLQCQECGERPPSLLATIAPPKTSSAKWDE